MALNRQGGSRVDRNQVPLDAKLWSWSGAEVSLEADGLHDDAVDEAGNDEVLVERVLRRVGFCGNDCGIALAAESTFLDQLSPAAHEKVDL